jgi:carbonic anhydrase
LRFLALRKLAEGTIIFKNDVFASHKAFFEPLAKEQHPIALMFTCCDSRIEPLLTTQSVPGTLFTVKNIGNIVPVYTSDKQSSSEAAAIEFALSTLNVRHIIVYGHTDCAAMKALLEIDTLPNASPIYQWLKSNRHTVDLLRDSEDPVERLNELIRRNIVQQLHNLATYPEVSKRLEKGDLHLYGWKYLMQTGETVLIDSLSCEAESLSRIIPELLQEDRPDISLSEIEQKSIEVYSDL